MKAALFVGGWEGHTPTEFSDWCAALLRENGFEVDIHDTLEPLATPGKLQDVDLIVPIWSSARSGHQEEFGNICLLYTSPSPRDQRGSRMPSSA